jgi:hypothetical protein
LAGWLVFGWWLVGVRLVFGFCSVGVWLVFGRCSVGLQFSWLIDLVGCWLIQVVLLVGIIMN